MPSPLIQRSRREIPIVLATAALVSFAPLWRATALTLTDLGIVAFFISGVSEGALGAAAPWVVLVAVLVGVACRAVDIESWALFVPKGLVGRVHEAFGARGVAAASAAVVLERLFLAALASLVAGHYLTEFLLPVVRPGESGAHLDISTVAGVFVLGGLWIRVRLGYPT